MQYITWLLLSTSLLLGSTGKVWAFQGAVSSTQLTLDTLTDAPIIPRVPQSKAHKIKLSRSVEETVTRLAQEVSIQIANDITYGLVIAHQKKQIRYGTRMYRKVQTAVNLLRRGAGLDGASRRSGVPRPVLDQLMQWGQQRPGASRYHVE